MPESKRRVKLFCPSLSKVVQLVAHDDQRLDLGSIARTFGLDPASLKLNGHFISRGVDLIASSVTWKSLISFFSSRGLSTGTTGSGALVVDGKLSKSGIKRANDSVNGIPSTSNWGFGNINGRPLIEESNSSKKMKRKDFDVERGTGKPFISNASNLKRKQEEANSFMKRLKLDGSGSETREDSCSNTILKTQFPCSLLGVNMKRMREDEMVLPAPCKKCR